MSQCHNKSRRNHFLHRKWDCYYKHSKCLLCATVCHSWGCCNIHKRWVWLRSSALPKERRAGDPGRVRCLLYPGDSSCYQGTLCDSKTLLLLRETYLRIFGSLHMVTVVSPVTVVLSFLVFLFLSLSSPSCTGRYLCVPADGPLHRCGFPRVPGFLWSCSCLLDLW